ncbi:MAG: PKD domain-containing protein, partial [Lachnospiraceae bacterium]|nr:PKD domain-containing protein [Lachnospiraceae bacterium]
MKTPMKTKTTHRPKTIFKRATAFLLFITMLPFSSFAGVGAREVNAAAVSANSIIPSEIESDISPETLSEDITKRIHTHGGEDIDSFVNKALQGEFPEEAENVIIEANDTLTEDLIVMDLTLKKGTFDLQGNTLYVCGNFIHSGGILKINGGRVVVLGNYRIQSPVQKAENEETEETGGENEAGEETETEEQDEYTTSQGCLQMIDESDYLLVMGDFYTDSEVSHSGWLDNGIMEVKGDFTQYTTKNMNNFLSTRNFRLYLTGTEGQKLEMSQRFYQGDCIANLVIENESEQGITMANNPCITGSITTNEAVIDGSISIGPETVFEEDYFDGGIRLSHASLAGRITQELTIGKDLTLEKNGGKLYIEKQLTVKGDAWIGNEVYPIGGSLVVEGDMTVDDGGDGHSCGIYMVQDNAYVLVEGDYIHKTQKGVPMPKGILEIKGNVTLGSTFVPEESHKMILSGEGAQYVSAEKGTVLNVLELQNHSDVGVILGENVTWKKLVKNDCKVTMGENSGYIGYTLEEDETFEEGFVLTGGILDLNGHTMTIKGDFIHSGGTVLVNGGQLLVESDYRMTERIIAPDGSCSDRESSRKLKMKKEEDYVLVIGTFYYNSDKQGGSELSAGCLELRGDFYEEETAYYHFVAGDNHTLLISGDKKQTIHFNEEEDCYDFPYIQNLNITNQSSEGVIIEGTPWVRGRCESVRESSIEGLVYKNFTDCYDWGEYYAGDLGTIFTLSLYSDFELGGDLYVHNRFNVHADLTVDGNIYMSDYPRWQYNGYIDLNGGRLIAKGDVEADSEYYYSGIKLQTDYDYALIEGNYRIRSKGSYGMYSPAGVLEVKGNIDFVAKDSYNGQLILSGDKKQTVRVGAGTDINQLKIENTSEDGICLESYIKVKSWEGGDCPITFKGEPCILGYSLTKDTTIDGNVVLLGGVMALNGYRLQINGNLTQIGGDIRINQGSLYINGDYYLGNPKEALEGYDMETSGMLYMSYEKDYVCVEGDFYESKSNGTWINLEAGTLELHGNMDYDNSLFSYGNHTLLLKGGRQQKITFYGTDTNRGNGLKNLTLDNQSKEGIVFVNNPYFIGSISDREENRVSGAIEIQSMGQLENGYFGGSIYYRTYELVTDEDIHIGGDLKIQCSHPTTISGQLQVDGNLDLDGILTMNQGSLLVGGDLNIRRNSSNYVSNGINMSHADDYVLVGGCFTNESGSTQRMNAGILEIKGDYREKEGIYYTGTHRIIFSGEERQVVEQQGRFHILELRNESEEGVFSENALKYDELITNGSRLVIGDETSVSGFTLTDDYIVAGDLYLVDGTLDLAGHTLVVQGDLILQEGEIKVNHGRLIVKGNFRQQKRKKMEEGYVYSGSDGHLCMNYEDDYMEVAGDYISMGPYSSGLDKKGTIKIGGNLDTRGGYDFRSQGTLILDGTGSQTVISGGGVEVKNLQITNQSAEGVNIAADITITGKVSDTEWKAGGNHAIIINDLNCLEEGRFGGNVVLNVQCRLQSDTDIRGNLTVKGALYPQDCQLYVGKDFTVEEYGAVYMDNHKGYLLINGNAVFGGNETSLLSAGTLEVKGSLEQKGSLANIRAEGEHRTVLSGSKNEAGEDIVQIVHLDAPDRNRFHVLILQKDFYTCYEFDTIPEDIADEVIYEQPVVLYPRPVTEIRTEQVTPFSVTIVFDGIWSEGETAGFSIYRDGVPVGSTGTKSYKDTGLEPGQTYTYTVFPYNGDKNHAKESPSLSVKTDSDGRPPEKVTNLRVTMRTGSAVTLTWDRGKDNVGVTGYRLYRDGVLVYEGSGVSYEDKGLKEKTIYQYTVEAIDGSGNVSEKCAPVDGVVFMPKILSVSPEDYGVMGGDGIELQVTFSGEGRSKGNAVTIEYYDENYNEWKPVTRTPIGQKEESGNVLTAAYFWDIEGLELGKQVDIRYTLRDKDGNSTEKTVTYTIDREAPFAPVDVTASDEGGTVVITWKKGGSADCEGYRLYRVQPDAGEGVFLADIKGKDSTWYEDADVKDGTTYQYYLRAYDGFNQLGEMSDIAKVTVEEDNKAPRMISMIPDAGRVAQTVTLIPEGKDNRAVTGFELYIRKNGEEEWEPLATVPAQEDKGEYLWDTTSCEETDYYIKAVAVDKAGNKSESLFMRRYEVDNTGVAKIILSECTVGSTAVQLTWEDVTEEDFAYFQVEEYKDGKWTPIGRVSDTLGIRIEELKPLTAYTYRVYGVDNLGNCGIPSDEITLTTTEDTTAPSITAIEPVSSYYGATIPLSMTVEDNDGVAYGIFSFSTDGESYVELARVKGGGKGSEKISYTWDTSALSEGDVYVRFEAYDNVGNHNALFEEKQIDNLYKIDHTPPGKVTGIQVTGEEGSVDLSWSKGEEEDIAGFRIYRAEEGQGRFVCIADKITYCKYTDTNVKENTTYIYRVAAVDMAGNEGEKSDKIYGSVRRDETAPEVTGISPDESILGRESFLQVLALDNACLKSIIVEYRMADSDDAWKEITSLSATGRACYEEIFWDAGGLSEGVPYEVRAKAIDKAGNESDYVYRTYTFDLTAPKAPVLETESGSFRILLSYGGSEEADFDCYKIYRKRYGEKDYTCIQSGTETEYTDLVEDTDAVYYYKVRAYDIYGNYSESNIETDYASVVDDIAPVALLPETIGGMEGEEVAFDGLLSTDNIRINRYEWDFGDGTTGVGVRPVHTYQEEGNYTVSLTVRDAKGNKATTTSTVEVIKPDNKGRVRLQVVSKYGVGIPGAYVYVSDSAGKGSKKLRCDSNGYVDIVGEAGQYYKVSAFSEGFLPGESVISIEPGKKTNQSIMLSKGEVVVGKITMHRMEINEMIAKGVDLTSPSNYHTFQFSVEIGFSESPIPATIDYEGPLEEAMMIDNIRIPSGDLHVMLLPPWEPLKGNADINGIRDVAPAVAYIKTTQSVSWLKDMYCVELGISNNAESGFDIHDASATIELPIGLTLATTNSGQTLTNRMGSIGGQMHSSTSWILKGEESGTYQIAARFHGVMSPFEAEMNARFVSQMEYDVQTGEGLHIYVYPEEAFYPGEKYYIHFEVKNESGRNFYNVKTSMGQFQMPEAVGEIVVKDWKTKEIISYERWEGDYLITDPSKKSLPVLTNGAKVECGILAPGASLFGTYVTVPEGNEDSYYKYVNSMVEELRGANLGVQVTVEPIPSHIVKCYQFMDQKTGTIYGDPVDLATGAFMQDVESFRVDGGSRLSLGMHYNSLSAAYKGECGYGWSHDYEQHIEDHGAFVELYISPCARISFVSEEAAEGVVYGRIEDGKVILDGEAAYEDTFYPTSQAFNGWSLTKTGDGYEVISKDGDIYRFNGEGRLSAVTSPGKKGITLAHEEGKTTIRDEASGEEMYLIYNEEGMVGQICDSHGRTMSLAYDGENLTAHTGADGQTTRYVYDGSHRLLYGVDGTGNVYVQNTYDDEGRIVAQKEAGIANTARYSYEEREDGGMTTTVLNYSGDTMSVTTNGKGEKIQEVDAAGAVISYTYDERGNLISETDGAGSTEYYTYDENNNVVSYRDKNGNATILAYDESGNIISTGNGNGTENSFAYDDAGRMVRSVSSSGAVTRYAYDEEGNAIRQITDGLGVISMTYEGGRLTGITDYNGNRTVYGYDAYGNRTTVTDALGGTASTVYDEAGKILSETAADGTTATYEYDAKGQKIKEIITGKTGGTKTTVYDYDAAGRMTAVTTAEGTTSYTYDGEGNVIAITYPDGSRDTLAYDSASRLVKAVTASGITTEYAYDIRGNKIQEKTGNSLTAYEYDGEGRICKKTEADGHEILYTYDERGNCLQESDQYGKTVTYTYDEASNLTSVTDAAGSTTSYTYDIYGRCIKATDPMGNSASYAYDGNGNCIRQTDGAGTVTEFTYDAGNRLTAASILTTEGKVTTTFAYDKTGRVTEVTDGEGNTTKAVYDSFGNLLSLTDASGRKVESNTYDSMGRLTESTDALGNMTACSYDKAGNITKIVECLNGTEEAETAFTYDADGRLLTVKDAEGSVSAQTYDATGNVTSVTDAMGGTTSYSYDSMNRVTEVVNAIGAKNSYTYNGEGLLTESRNAGGSKTTYEYDVVGRIVKQKDKEGTITYTYDKNGNVLTVKDKNGTITRTYDELNRVTSVTDYKGDTIAYGYDQLGNRISIMYPGGEKVRYTYDRTGNLKTVTDAEGNVTYYTYDENGRLTETLRGDGSRETRSYDAAGHLLTLKDETAGGEVINDYAYEYDGRGNITKIEGMDGGISSSDGVAADGVLAVSMTYDADNRLLTYNGQTVEYDAEGNMTKGPLNGGMAEFTYDCRNRLIKVKEADGTVTTYEYDAENVRTAKVTGGVRTEYTTDRESTYSQVLVKKEYEKNVFGLYTEQKNATTYVYGTGLVSERRDGGEEFYYHYNHLGSTVAVSDKGGNIVYRFVYDTYGELSDIQNANRISLKTVKEAQEYTLAELAGAAGIEYLYNGKYGVT